MVSPAAVGIVLAAAVAGNAVAAADIAAIVVAADNVQGAADTGAARNYNRLLDPASAYRACNPALEAVVVAAEAVAALADDTEADAIVVADTDLGATAAPYLPYRHQDRYSDARDAADKGVEPAHIQVFALPFPCMAYKHAVRPDNLVAAGMAVAALAAVVEVRAAAVAAAETGEAAEAPVAVALVVTAAQAAGGKARARGAAAPHKLSALPAPARHKDSVQVREAA